MPLSKNSNEKLNSDNYSSKNEEAELERISKELHKWKKTFTMMYLFSSNKKATHESKTLDSKRKFVSADEICGKKISDLLIKDYSALDLNFFELIIGRAKKIQDRSDLETVLNFLKPIKFEIAFNEKNTFSLDSDEVNPFFFRRCKLIRFYDENLRMDSRYEEIMRDRRKIAKISEEFFFGLLIRNFESKVPDEILGRADIIDEGLKNFEISLRVTRRRKLCIAEMWLKFVGISSLIIRAFEKDGSEIQSQIRLKQKEAIETFNKIFLKADLGEINHRNPSVEQVGTQEDLSETLLTVVNAVTLVFQNSEFVWSINSSLLNKILSYWLKESYPIFYKNLSFSVKKKFWPFWRNFFFVIMKLDSLDL
ncbi:hypothetical protein BY996DRAFT_7166692 [Phakopsora pachyrhizi]|nr:hypothetical protein BY996DRAFT_7166692 [Phakopsora pachyrhizi]